MLGNVIEAYMIVLFVMTVAVWFALTIQSHRLFYRFREKYPAVAGREIPQAFEYRRHPEKFFYFFRHKSLTILQTDNELGCLRQKVKVLTILSGVVPFVGFLLLMVFALYFGSLHLTPGDAVARY